MNVLTYLLIYLLTYLLTYLFLEIEISSLSLVSLLHIETQIVPN